MSDDDDFLQRYPHGVLTEQEGGVPNEVMYWERANHVCRKHRVTEVRCPDGERGSEAQRAEDE